MESTSNFDRALLEIPDNSHPRNKREQMRMWLAELPERRKMWRAELEGEKEWEQRLVKSHEVIRGSIVVDLLLKKRFLRVPNPDSIKLNLGFYSNNIDNIFHAMHRIVYIESLLNVDVPEMDFTENTD